MIMIKGTRKITILFVKSLILLGVIGAPDRIYAQSITLPTEAASIVFDNPIVYNNMTFIVENNPSNEPFTDVAIMAGVTCRRIPSGKFMYVGCNRAVIPASQNNLVIAITYYAGSNNNIWFNYNSPTNNYQGADFQKTKSGQWATAIIPLTNAAFNNNMNGVDFRLGYGGEDNYIREIKVYKTTLDPVAQPIPASPGSAISEFKNKSFAGYQIWHKAGPAAADWVHWSYGVIPAAGFHINEDIASFPDISEVPAAESYATNFAALGNGTATRLYNSGDASIINRQMSWCQTAGLDGVAIQRFVGAPLGKSITITPTSHLSNVKNACEATGRLFYICYDLNGTDADILQRLQTDWVYEIEQIRALTSSPNYATVNGKPVVEMWGVGYNMATSTQCQQLINFFKSRGCYVIGGVPNDWRTSPGPGFASVFTSLNSVSPWTVGVYNTIPGANNYMANNMIPDKNYCTANGMDYLPVVFAGAANWVNADFTLSQTNREGGKYFWQQILNAKSNGLTSVYLAMLDEFEESTNLINGAVDYFDIPTDQYFETFAKDGVWTSSDYYLRLAGRASRMLRGEIPVSTTIDVPYSNGPLYFRNSFESRATTIRTEGRALDVTLKIDPCFFNPAVVSQTGVNSPLVTIVNEPAFTKTGLYSAKITGTPTSGTNANYYYKTSETKIEVKPGMQLRFWKYAVNTLGQYTSVDLIFQSGKRLKDLPAYVDNNGSAMTPAVARGAIGTWQQFICQIGTGELVGDVITGIVIGYDHPATSGSFAAYIDDVIVDIDLVALPVTLLSVEAMRTASGVVNIVWNVANEIDMKQYEVERSSDGRYFTSIQTIATLGDASYRVMDDHPLATGTYYRIKSISLNGQVDYSTIRFVPAASASFSIIAYPNPLETGKVLSIEVTNQEASYYHVRLYNGWGQSVFETDWHAEIGISNHSMHLPTQLTSGAYQLEIISESGHRVLQKIVVQ